MTTGNNAKHIAMSPSAIVLNEANVNSGILAKENKLLNNPNLWHKVIVQNCSTLSRDIILKTILDTC